jgi:diaminohydroxyphosphoribosylaminopyrimidine deaminase/5-amino-6-(5-phosphoribosylamino)uracil reductase
MKLRQGNDAILAGINTILADNPSLTFRKRKAESGKRKQLRRIILDSLARTPLTAKVVSDEFAALTTIVVSKAAPKGRVAALAKRVNVVVAPLKKSAIRDPQSQLDLRWLLRKLGGENVISLLVEGGGEVNASFLLGGFTHRIAFFYAPKILGGRKAHKAVAGDGARELVEALRLHDVEWKRIGPDLLLTARVDEI